MSEMRCKCCGANENRIDGFCSVECKNYYDLETQIAELEAERRWIPVSERLPEDGEVVWFWDGYSMCMGYYLVYAGEFIERDTPLRRIKPTHWMPLPEPPEVQE